MNLNEYISNPQYPADLVTFTEEILNGKLHFLCRIISEYIFVKIQAQGCKVTLHKK